MHLRRITRSPVPFWTATAVLAGFTFAVVGGITDRAAEHERRLGAVRPVAVMVRAVPAGHVLGVADVSVRRLPAALLPQGAIEAVVGRVALVPLVPGEAVVRARVGPPNRTGLAALVPRGRSAIAVSVGPASLALEVGDVVDVLATSTAPGAAPFATTVATAAIVVHVGRGVVTVAVSYREVARVAAATAIAVTTIALRGAA